MFQLKSHVSNWNMFQSETCKVKHVSEMKHEEDSMADTCFSKT